VSYEEWESSVPERLRADPLWSLRVYRTALYAGELGRADAALVARLDEYDHVATQLARATASISANIAEGYSRLGPRDRGRYYEFALGSAREARDWYFKARGALGTEVAEGRMDLHTTLVKILTVLARQNRPTMPAAAASSD